MTRLTREFGVDFQLKGEPMTPMFDPVLESMKNLERAETEQYPCGPPEDDGLITIEVAPEYESTS